MSTQLEAIVAGETFNLSDLVTFQHLGNDGFGLPNVEILAERGPFQDGTTFNRSVLQPRTIQLVLMGYGDTEQGYFDVREELMYIFSPRQTAIQLRFTRPDGSVRQIDAYYAGGLSLPSSDRYGNTMQKVGVSLYCPDPTFYNPVSDAYNFGLSAAAASGVIVPVPVPVGVGASDLNQSTAIPYMGTADAYPVITVVGPLQDMVITNQVTGDKLDFTGYNVSSTNGLVIDTRYGSKRVTSSGISQLGYLTSDSDLATFRLLKRPDAPGGINSISVTGTGATTTTAVYFTFSTRYIGL